MTGVRWYYGILAAIVTYAIVGQIVMNIHDDKSIVDMFSYFTIQSNVLVLVTSWILAFRPDIAGNVWRPVRLAALTGITVTGLVYWTVLAWSVHLSGVALFYNYLFHLVSPLMTILGFVFIGPRLQLARRDMIFLVWPVLYLVYTMVRAAVADPTFQGLGEKPSQYPYPFLDASEVGVPAVIASIALVAAIITGVGFAYIHAEARLEARQARRLAPAQ